MWEKRWLQTGKKPPQNPNLVRGIPGVSSLTRRWGQKRFNEKRLSARNKFLKLETVSHRRFLLVSLQKSAGLHSSRLCFPRPHSYGCFRFIFFFSWDTRNHTKYDNNNFFPPHTYYKKFLDWAKTKWKLVWVCVLTSLDLSMGLCNRPFWKSLLLSPPVCTFSPEAAFPFIISQSLNSKSLSVLWLLVSMSEHSPGQPQVMFRLSGQFIFLGTSSLKRHFTLSHVLGDFSLIAR